MIDLASFERVYTRHRKVQYLFERGMIYRVKEAVDMLDRSIFAYDCACGITCYGVVIEVIVLTLSSEQRAFSILKGSTQPPLEGFTQGTGRYHIFSKDELYIV